MTKVQSYRILIKSFCLFIFILGSIFPLSTTIIEIDASESHIFERRNFEPKGEYYEVYIYKIEFNGVTISRLDNHPLSAYVDFIDSPSETTSKFIFYTWLLGILLIFISSLLNVINVEIRFLKRPRIDSAIITFAGFTSLVINYLILGYFMIPHEEGVDTSTGRFYMKNSTDLHPMFFLTGIAIVILGLLPIITKRNQTIVRNPL